MRALFLALLMAVGCAHAQDNLVANPSFELPAEDGKGPAGWIVPTLPGAEFAWDDRIAHSGSRSARVTVPANQVSRITASCGEMKALSNPILPRKPEEPGIHFGDIHSHCEISADAVGDPDLAHEYARRFFGMDFAGLSDHSPRRRNWQRKIEVTNRHNWDRRSLWTRPIPPG